MADINQQMDRFEELCAGYVLNALEPEEREEFLNMYRNASEEERAFFLDLRSAAHQLAFTIERSEPLDVVKGGILSRILPEAGSGEVHGETEEKGDTDKSYFAIAASFALLILSLSLLFYSFNLGSQLAEKEQVIANQQSRITSLQNEIEQSKELLSILESREVNVVILAGMEASPNAYGKIIWNPGQDGALLQVSNLPVVPPDKEYQLWMILNNLSVSAGVFAVQNPASDTFFKIEQMDATDASVEAFAVTMEPKGGMPRPTGDMYLMGNVEND